MFDWHLVVTKVQIPSHSYVYMMCTGFTHCPLVDAQTQLASATEKERSAVEKELTLQSRIGTLDAQLSSLRQEKSQLLASLELERAKLETLEEGQQR